MDNSSSSKNAHEGHSGEDYARLQDRLAKLEEGVRRIIEFNQATTKALTHALVRLNELEPAIGRVGQIDRKTSNLRFAETLAHASHIFPKSRTVVFVGRGYFGDNIKYAFLAFCNYARSKNISVHFLTDDPKQYALLTENGFPCLPCDASDWSIEDVRALLGAKVAVLSDNFHPQSFRSSKSFGMLQGAKTMQLWHGIPIKNVGLRYLLRADNYLLDELIASSGPFDVFVAPGGAARDEWAEMFAFREFAALGYPRNDVLQRDLNAHDRLSTDTETLALFEGAKRAGKTTILYTPTYRDDIASGWFDRSNIASFCNLMRERGYIFAINLHPYEQSLLEDFLQRYPDIHFVVPNTDIYPVLKFADLLITDYSSLAFDYLLLDRPLVFFRPDHDDYMTKNRGFIPGKEKLTPGAVTSNIEELMRAVDSAVNYARAPASDPSRIARHNLRSKLFDHIDGNAAQRICERIEVMLDES